MKPEVSFETINCVMYIESVLFLMYSITCLIV